MPNGVIDIVGFSFTPMLWHKTPYLMCNIELGNDSNTGKSLIPIGARLIVIDELVAFALPSFRSLDRSSPGGTVTSYRGGAIAPLDVHWEPANASPHRSLYCCFEISAMALASLSNRFESYDIGTYRVELELAVFEDRKMMVAHEPGVAPVQQTIPVLSRAVAPYIQGNLNKHEWMAWMRTWGVACEAVYIPSKLAMELREIVPTMGVGFEWEVITELLKGYQGGKAETVLVTSEDALKLKMGQLIGAANQELLIMCRALDEMLLPDVLQAHERGADVRIITVPTQRLKKEQYQETGRIEKALRRASAKLKLRQNIDQHARVIVSEQAALVGSADPDYHGLNIHKNASVYTTNSTVKHAARQFFEKVWDESEEHVSGT